MKKIEFVDTYTKEDVETLNLLMFITSMIMLVLCIIAEIGGLL